MKSTDIKVGEDYAYQSHKHATPTRATVLEKGITQTEGRFSWERRTVQNGVRITLHLAKGPTERVVTSRQISEPWADWVVKRDAQAEARRRSDAIAAENRAARWARIAKVDEVFADLGVEPQVDYLFRANERAAAEAAGFTVTDGDTVLLHGVDGDGKVSLEATELLADTYVSLRGEAVQ